MKRLVAVLSAVACSAALTVAAPVVADAQNPGLASAPAVTAAKKATPKLNLFPIKKAVGGGVIITGDKIKIGGSASPSLIGQTVSLQRKVGKTWVSAAASGKVGKNRKFYFEARSAGNGATGYRVVSKATKKLNAGASNVRTITIYKWWNLAQQEYISYEGNSYLDRTIAIAGRSYAHSNYGVYNLNWIEYNLSFRCVQFRTVVGPTDSSQSGSSRLFSVQIDGSERAATTVAVGSSQALTVDTTQGFRIHLEDNRTAGSKSSYSGWGTPRVLCSSSPGVPRS